MKSIHFVSITVIALSFGSSARVINHNNVNTTLNDIRPHNSCHMLNPNQMHRQREVKMKTYKNKNSVENVLNTV